MGTLWSTIVVTAGIGRNFGHGGGRLFFSARAMEIYLVRKVLLMVIDLCNTYNTLVIHIIPEMGNSKILTHAQGHMTTC